MVIATATSTFSSTNIHNSDWCNTLVSLNHGLSSKKQQQSSTKKPLQQEQKLPFLSTELRQTTLMLDDGSPLTIPAQSTSSISANASASALSCDEYIQNCVPILRQSAHQLLLEGGKPHPHHHVFHRHSPERLLYVHQGELAHAVPSQCDVLVSDRATTCHILVLRSTSVATSYCSSNSSSGTQPPLTTMTHLDNTTCYESCLRTAIQHHKKHHAGFITTDEDEDEDELFFDKPISMEIHILGGFCDPEGTSQRITNWLLHFLADIAEEEAACLEFTLKSCVISTLNNATTSTSSSNSNAPIGRGLAIRLDTGHIGLAKVLPDVMGPSLPLRNARLWSLACLSSEQQQQHNRATLQLIHTTSTSTTTTTTMHNKNQSYLTFQPFWFQCWEGVNDLLDLPDDILIEYTSTSPSVEEKDFCQVVRNTLQFIKGTSCQVVFGPDLDRPLCFERQYGDISDIGQTTSATNKNQWKLVVR